MSELQERNRAVWASGDWDGMSHLIRTSGPHLLDTAGVDPGMDVLDVGTGSGGNVAIPAAQRGARVTGADLTDEWFGAARERAAAAGVDVDWVVGDAQELPFADASFDRVLSTFGHMFAPDHRRAADELVRVCRPGGVVGTTTWLSEGYGGAIFKLLGSFAPLLPPGASPPPLWGDRDHVRAMFAPLEPEFSEGAVSYGFDRAADKVDFFLSHFGPAVTLSAVLGEERAAELRSAWIDVAEQWNVGGDDGWAVEQAYLITILRKP